MRIIVLMILIQIFESECNDRTSKITSNRKTEHPIEDSPLATKHGVPNVKKQLPRTVDGPSNNRR